MAIYHQIWESIVEIKEFRSLVKEYKFSAIHNPSDYNNLATKFLRIVRSLLIIFPLGTILLNVWHIIIDLYKNNFNFKETYHHFSIDQDSIFAIIIFLIAHLICSISIRKLNSVIINNDFYLEKINQISTELISVRNEINFNCENSFSYFSFYANKVNDYNSFIKHLEEGTGLTPENLTAIPDLAKASRNSEFKCVISYLDFFKDESEFKQMINYFGSFEPICHNNNNTVKRIFSIPGKKTNKGDILYTSILTKEKNLYLYFYLLVNKLSGCDPYIMIFDEEYYKVNKATFFIHGDYFLAYSKTENLGKSDSNLYFAYPDNEEMNRTIKTKDSFLTKVFETDFSNRIRLSESIANPVTMKRFNKSSISDAFKMLDITAGDKKRFNELLILMRIQLASNNEINKDSYSDLRGYIL
jgi:hypothetical protein